MSPKEETVKTYNRSAAALAQYFDGIGSRLTDIQRGLSYVAKKNPQVLELGCGNGRDAKDILRFTDHYLGVDISSEMIKLAKEDLPDASFLVADIETFIFSEQIDIIFAFASLLHLNKEAVREVLHKAYQSLSNNGIFYISVKRDQYQAKIKDDTFGRRIFYYYTEDDFKELAQETGYTIVWEERRTLQDTEWLVVVLQKS